MTEAIGIEILDYNESLAEDVAAMWNTWDELWPGGFTQGVPYTAERVHKQFGKSDALAILIAVDNETKKPLGSCTLFAHWRDTEAAYVGTLGVSPEALGKKIGKRLLLESISRASQKGYTRVDLNTWAGNMKAVPLYKKIGMMWNPEISGVHMEDYVPGILQHPLCRPFFVPLSGKDDWYDVHVRDPVQAPDEFEMDGLASYPYQFTNGDDHLSVIVDRYGRGITSIERTIGESKLKVAAKISSHQVLCGLSYTYTLNVVNGTKSDISVSAGLKAFDGLVFDDKSSVSKKVKPGEKFEWTLPYHLDPSAPLFRDSIKAPTIITEVEVDGEKSELITGLKVKPAAEIKTRWGIARIAAGGQTSIPLTVVNNLPTKRTATIQFDSNDSRIKVTLDDKKIKLDGDGFGGTVLHVSSDSELEEGAHDIWVWFEIENGSDSIVRTRKFRIPVFCLGNRGVVVGQDDIRRRLVIVSSLYHAYFSIEGAILNANNSFSPSETGLQVRSAIGPPFGINPFRFAEREPIITTSDSETIVSMRAHHPNRPLDIEDRARFEHGTGIILHEIWVTNTSTESETFQLRLVGRGGGISFAEGDMYIPLASGVVKEKLGNFYASYPAIPSEPSIFSEGWIANEQGGVFTGEMWDNSAIEEIRVGHAQMNLISYPQVTLEPGETRRISQLWFVYGAQSWAHVRRIWRSRVLGYYGDRVESFRSETPSALVNLEIEPMVIPHKQDTEGEVRLSKSTVVPLKGQLRCFAPEGWTSTIIPTDIELESAEQGAIASGGIHLTQDATFQLKLNPGPKVADEFGVYRALVEFKTDWELRKRLHLVQLGTTKGTVEVHEDKQHGLSVFHVKNGLIEFTVSPDFGGCLISLKNSKGVEFLDNSFPTPAPKPGGFFDNYYGGIQPFVFDEEMGEDLDKSRTNKEKMKGIEFEDGFWKGVEISWKGKLQKLAKGVDFKIRYLTTVRSPLVFMQWVITNRTKAPLKFWPTLLVDPKITEQLAGGGFQTIWDDEAVDLRKGMIPVAVTPTQNVVWLKPNNDQDSTSGFSFMMGGHDSRMIAANLGELMLLGGVDGVTWLMPGEKKILTAGFLVDPKSMDDVRAIQEVLDAL
ncbi:MAG: GNAT family N-acetyltransferase [Candidatus Thorarchaeota archaeon]